MSDYRNFFKGGLAGRKMGQKLEEDKESSETIFFPFFQTKKNNSITVYW